MSKGIESAYKRLMEETDATAYAERRLAMARSRRDQLIVKLHVAGESTRAIGEVCDISSCGVSWIVRRYKRGAQLKAEDTRP